MKRFCPIIFVTIAFMIFSSRIVYVLLVESDQKICFTFTIGTKEEKKNVLLCDQIWYQDYCDKKLNKLRIGKPDFQVFPKVKY